MASTSSDKTVRVWNTETVRCCRLTSLVPVLTQCRVQKECVNSHQFTKPVRSASFSPDGQFLAVGLVSLRGHTCSALTSDPSSPVMSPCLTSLSGVTRCLSRRLQVSGSYAWPSVQTSRTGRDAGETVDCLDWKPDSTAFAAGSWDQVTYQVNTAGKVLTKSKGHTSSVLMVNYSSDGNYLVTNSRDYEILFCELSPTVGRLLLLGANEADAQGTLQLASVSTRVPLLMLSGRTGTA